jgi:hypothetical protein
MGDLVGCIRPHTPGQLAFDFGTSTMAIIRTTAEPREYERVMTYTADGLVNEYVGNDRVN